MRRDIASGGREWLLAGFICLALYAVFNGCAQGGELAPWAGGSMPPIGSSFGYRGSTGGYSQPYYYDSQPVYHRNYTYTDPGWTVVPQRQPQRYIERRTIIYHQPATYRWQMRIGCLGQVYWVLERDCFNW